MTAAIAPGIAGRRGAAADVYPDPEALRRVGIDPDRLPAEAASTGPPVTVAIVDSGVMADHPDLRPHVGAVLRGRAVRGVQCLDGQWSEDVVDEDGHGTMLAGTIVAAAGRSRAVRLVGVKFFDGAVVPSTRRAVEAVRWAADAGVDIVNLSWDVGFGSPALREAIGQACAQGALVVIAAGNDGSDGARWPAVPARYRDVCPSQIVTVMATGRDGERAWFSSYGSGVDLAAPGMRILTTRSAPWAPRRPSARPYARHSGTSVAAALVTGAAALLKVAAPHLSAAQMKECLVRSVDASPPLPCASGGRLDIPAALRLARTIGITPGGPPAAGGRPAGPGAPGRGSHTAP